MSARLTRREVLTSIGAGATGGLLLPAVARADDPPPEPPTSPVAIAKCATYGDELAPAVAGMFEQLGGLAQLVEGKTVAVKVNMIGYSWAPLVPGLPVEMTHWTHPLVVRAVIEQLGKAGATRIRVLECCGDNILPFADNLVEAGWNPDVYLKAAPNVEIINTNGPGPDGTYSTIWCPKGGYIFPGYCLNSAYTDCDVLVSIPKMKEHKWFGVTLSMKNCYGMTPLNFYGDLAGEDEPSVEVKGTRVTVFHNGFKAPPKAAPQELDPNSPREGGYRIPRIVADIVSARPIHLAVIDGVTSMAGGEGPWAPKGRPVKPGVLLAGFNPVTTDAVAMAVMGFDPMADNGAVPFEGCDSFLRFAEELGLGTRDLSKIEVRGVPIEEARFEFRNAGLPPPEA